jgi:putative transposase
MKACGYGVELICGVLREQGVAVAPRSYRAWKTRRAAERTRTDALLLNRLRALKARDAKGRQAPEVLYGRRKMTAWLARTGLPNVSKHTVDRLMRLERMNGLVRGRKARTTIQGKDGRRAGDLLNRDFTATAPNTVWVTDFTYVATWSGFVYVAFAIDLFSRTLVGWSISTVKDTAFVEICLQMALWRRDHTGHPVTGRLIHHSDAGSQGGFNRSSQHLDHGGVRWDAVGSRYRKRQRVCGGSGRRIGRCGHRCVHQAGRSPLVRCSGSFGGLSRRA